MKYLSFARPLSLCVAALLFTVIGGCGAFRSTQSPQPTFYSLDNARLEVPVATYTPTKLSQTEPTLVVNPPHAAAGFDSQHIIYVREPHQLEYYAHNEWIDTPARMVAPLIVAAVENTGTFRAVLLAQTAARGDLRLDTEIMRLQHDIGRHPSHVRFTMRAYIVDNTTRQVVAWREFDEIVTSQNESPYGGVSAANRAVQVVLERLAVFCTEATKAWQMSVGSLQKNIDLD